MGLLNKILLILILLSGFLLIFYANIDINLSELFRGPASAGSQNQRLVDNDPAQQEQHLAMADSPGAWNSGSSFNADAERKRRNHTSMFNNNLFVIYTKETSVLQTKYELLLKSLFKYTTIPLHLHVLTDAKSTYNAEDIARTQMQHYRRPALITLLDVEECVDKINDIVQVMMPYFSSHPGSYYSDALFYLSLGMHRIVDPKMQRGILIDCDVVFRSDVKLLFDQFHLFDGDNLFGLAPELTPVYRHTLYLYRSQNPGTTLGSPYYYPHSSGGGNTRRIRHGYPGLNSGVVMLDFERMRGSTFYAENLEAEQVERLVQKYHFRGHLGDQDFYTLLGYEFPSLVYRLDCAWNRQLCLWWKDHGYSEVFDAYFHCEGRIRLYHGNCNTRIPE